MEYHDPLSNNNTHKLLKTALTKYITKNFNNEHNCEIIFQTINKI